jgi:hypothetical protein
MHEYILDALETVMSWELPEEDLADALNDQIRLMSCVNPDEFRETPTD